MQRNFFSLFLAPVVGYIYVPFTKDELSQDFIDLAWGFKTESGRAGKKYSVIYYGEKALAELPKNAKIYVLGHGIDLSADTKWQSAMLDPSTPYEKLKGLPFSDWAYALTAGKTAISIDTIAERMKADGLLESDGLIIKLFFCDFNQKAFALAKRFMSNLEGSKPSYRIDYYLNQKLLTPVEESGTAHKLAEDSTTHTRVRASLTRKSLYC